MKLESVGEIIATRKFILAREEHQPVEVIVWMGKPEKFPTTQMITVHIKLRARADTR
jgi:hypothetical protein